MPTELLRWDLRLRRRSTVGYALGLAAYTFLIVALYPAMRHDTGLDALTSGGNAAAALFGAVGSITSPAGWMNANLFANFAPLLILLATVGYGASCIAGQNDDGTLALTAVLPFSRRALLLAKVAAMVVQAAVIAVACGLVALAGRSFELPLAFGNLLATAAGVLLLGLDLGLVALVVGLLTRSRGVALGVTSALAVVMYVISAMAPVVGWVHAVRGASLFYWAVGRNQVAVGMPATGYAVLVWAGVALTVAACWAFERFAID